MKKNPVLKFAVIAFAAALAVLACQEKKAKETILEGNATVLVDESLYEILEDQQIVFESQYPGKIKLIGKPESEIVNDLLQGKEKIAVLTRPLSKEESKIFESRQVVPRITPFGTDAIALITNKTSQDTLADLQEIIQLMQGKPSRIKGLVFDNPNSGTVRFMDSLAGVKPGEKKNIYSMKNHQEVVKFIAENPGVIGVVGLNPILQPTPQWQKYADKVKVMAVRNVKNAGNATAYFKPSQSNMATDSYPLCRKLYLLNYQGSAGLGTGFASFVAGETGQRILLKSGLLPIRIPGRNIMIRNEINNIK